MQFGEAGDRRKYLTTRGTCTLRAFLNNAIMTMSSGSDYDRKKTGTDLSSAPELETGSRVIFNGVAAGAGVIQNL